MRSDAQRAAAATTGGPRQNSQVEGSYTSQCSNGEPVEYEKAQSAEHGARDGVPFAQALKQKLQQIDTFRMEQETWAERCRHSQNNLATVTGQLWDTQQEVIERLMKSNRKQEMLIQSLQSRNKTLEAEKDQLFAEVQEKDRTTRDLTRDLAQLANLRPECTRDDDFFHKEFTVVFLSAQGWVLQHIVRVLDTQLENLPRELYDELIPLMGTGEHLFRRMRMSHLRVFEAFVVKKIADLLLVPELLGIMGPCYADLEKSLQNSSLQELEQWRAMTNAMIMRHPKFEATVSHRLDEAALSILKTLEQFIPPSNRKRGDKRLREVLERVRAIAIERAKQPCKFNVRYLERRRPIFQANCMSCVDGNIALENEGARVDFAISPMVTRVSEDGEIVVRTARVAITRRSAGR
ncbi:hypothetical protein BDZ91DRAFT_748472 [Kalaharituber pfeilii]|nr:hypothetical protein BDZ91DRAFT_748472 [Kalaharituber pfeilii]